MTEGGKRQVTADTDFAGNDAFTLPRSRSFHEAGNHPPDIARRVKPGGLIPRHTTCIPHSARDAPRVRITSSTQAQAVTTFANTGPCMNRTSCWRSSSHCVSSTTPSKINGIRTRCAYATSALTIPSRNAMPASILM